LSDVEVAPDRPWTKSVLPTAWYSIVKASVAAWLDRQEAEGRDGPEELERGLPVTK
jgi:hypothetical protein